MSSPSTRQKGVMMIVSVRLLHLIFVRV